MKTKWIVVTLIALFAVCGIAKAQSGFVQVTAQVQDPNGQLYQGGSYNVQFYDPGTSGQLPLLNGSPFQQVYNGQQLDSFGNLSIALPDNSIICSGSGECGTMWTFSICSAQYTTPTSQKYCFTYRTAITGSSVNLTTALKAVAATLPSAGGGGTPCTSAPNALQYNNAGAFGCAPGTSVAATTPEVYLPNVAPSGPRPYIDVTAPPYSADPTGATDSTTAIQAAVTAACNISISAGRPAVFLPPGIFKVTQTQTGVSATAPIFTGCSDLDVIGGRGLGSGGQFSNPPAGGTINVTAGASPNGAGVFGFTTQDNITFENLTMNCYNQCLNFYDSGGIHITNDSLSVQNTSGTDNTPLKVTNSFWVWVTGGTLQTVSPSTPTFLMTGETPVNGEAPLVGLVHVKDLVTAGGSFEYIQRVGCTSQAGTWAFDHITMEDTAMADLTITESSAGLAANACYPSGITFNQVGFSDTQGGTSENLMYENTQSLVVREVSVTQSSGKIYLSGAGVPILSNVIISGDSIGAYIVQNGAIIGDQVLGSTETQGFDFQAPAFVPTSSNAFPNNYAGFGSDASHGVPNARWYVNGATYATVAIDPSIGVEFGPGGTNQLGFGGGWHETTPYTLDFITPTLPAPTSFTGTATTGGSLAAGTYYPIIWVTYNGNCNGSNASLSTTIAASPIVVSGSNNALSLTWVAPQAGPESPDDYCIQVTPSQLGNAGAPDQRVQQAYEFAAPATSLLFTGQSQTFFGTSYNAFNVMTAVHRFTYNALGVGTLSPVPGTITTPGGYTGAFSTHSTAYTLAYTDSTITVTGTTTITVPHALPGSGLGEKWLVVNAGTNTVTLVCDSGNINGTTSVTLAANASGFVTGDGTNCWEH